MSMRAVLLVLLALSTTAEMAWRGDGHGRFPRPGRQALGHPTATSSGVPNFLAPPMARRSSLATVCSLSPNPPNSFALQPLMAAFVSNAATPTVMPLVLNATKPSSADGWPHGTGRSPSAASNTKARSSNGKILRLPTRSPPSRRVSPRCKRRPMPFAHLTA